MNKFLLTFLTIFGALALNAQCSELFFSEYVEGYSNNKALEIYNPTQSAVNLSDYSIARFSNGSTSAGDTKVISLPNVMLESDDVFVVVVDLIDTTLWDSQFDKPAWNGYNVIDTIFDAVTGEALLDDDGNVQIGPIYVDGSAIFGTEYNEEYDLQCKADVFLCPDYDTNNTMYFNGNDAMALLLGDAVANDGSNILDVIGVIGEDPTSSIEEDAWVDVDGGWVTKDKTIVRNYAVAGGRNEPSMTVASLGGTFVGAEWKKYNKNDFSYLGIHKSVCNAEETPNQYSCSTGPVNTNPVNLVDFNVYPNPTSIGSIEIQSEESIASVELINMVGQSVLKQRINHTSKSTMIDLQNMGSGIYVLKVQFNGNMISTKKLIVE